jgi:hypothetical protein
MQSEHSHSPPGPTITPPCLTKGRAGAADVKSPLGLRPPYDSGAWLSSRLSRRHASP